MPILSSAKKSLRQSKKHASRNSRFQSLYKEAVKKFERAIVSTDLSEGSTLLAHIYSYADKLAKKNIIHPKNASRKKAKFASLLKKASLQK